MMTARRFLLALLGVIGVIVGIGIATGLAGSETKAPGGTAANKSDNNSWEYSVLSLPDGNVHGIHEKWTPELNRVSRDGWEVVTAVPLTLHGDSSGLRVLLKRVRR